MNSNITKHNRTLASLIHLSVFSQFLIPLGNFIFPIIFWTVNRKDAFVDNHGRSALNFQISMFLYGALILAIGISGFIFLGVQLNLAEPFFFNDNDFPIHEFSQALPFIIWACVLGFTILGLFILEIFAVINAAIKAGDGELYKYPLSIGFIAPRNMESQNTFNKEPKEETEI